MFLLMVLNINLIHAEDPVTEEMPARPAGATITGQGTIELRIDVTQYLKEMGLVLIPESAAAELKDIRNKRWLDSASRLKFNAGYYYLDLKSIGYFAVQNAVQRTKTDTEGRFTFNGIQPGKYRIYGQYKSRYAAGYWLIPVEVKTLEDKLTINIDNENLEEIYNRELK